MAFSCLINIFLLAGLKRTNRHKRKYDIKFKKKHTSERLEKNTLQLLKYGDLKFKPVCKAVRVALGVSVQSEKLYQRVSIGGNMKGDPGKWTWSGISPKRRKD